MDGITTPDLQVREEMQQRVLWLAARMVDHANHERHPPVRWAYHRRSEVPGNRTVSSRTVSSRTVSKGWNR